MESYSGYRQCDASGVYDSFFVGSIDNNAVEREMRSTAIGRNNWLFCGSDRGGRAAAVHFSLIASCRRHGLDPFVYLRSVLTELAKLGTDATAERLRALLPDRHRPS